MPNKIFLVPTRTFFQKPIFDEVTGLKQLWLQEKLGVQYRENLSTQQKWTSLIASFSDSIDRASLPFDTQTLRQYRASRLNVLDNQHNLSLAQTLDYFEFFYFFFDNTHPKFSLSQDNKISLLRGLFEAIRPHTCEVGRGARFEAEFNLWLKTNDILFDELYKMRNGIIDELAVRYNAEHHAGEAMSVHTVYAMKKYVANRFGLANVHEVQDVYLSNESQIAMHQYVDAHAQAQFDLYIEETAQRLSACVLGQIEELLGLSHENKETLKHSSLKLTSDQYQVMLYPYLKTLLCFSLYEDNRNLVDGMTIEDDDETGIYRLERYDILRPKLKFAIEQVLTQKGYFVNLADLSRNQIDAYDLILKKDIDVDMLWSAYQEVSNLEINSDTDLKKYQKVFKAYPQLIVSLIISSPHGWTLFPKTWVYHPRILSGLMKALIDELTTQPMRQVEPHLIKIINQLLNIDANFISKLEPYLRSNPSLVNQLIGIEPKFSYYRFQEQINADEADEKDDFDLGPEAPVALEEELLNPFEREKKQNIEALKNTPLLDLGQVVHRLLKLNPQDLIKIAKYRQQMGYSAVPFFNEALMQKFIKEINTEAWENQGYTEVRLQALKNLTVLSVGDNVSEYKIRKSCLEAIVANEYWYLTYLQYYQIFSINKRGFRNFNDVLEHIQKNIEITLSVVTNLFNQCMLPLLLKYLRIKISTYLYYLAEFLTLEFVMNAMATSFSVHLLSLCLGYFIFMTVLAFALNDLFNPEAEDYYVAFLGSFIFTSVFMLIKPTKIIECAILFVLLMGGQFVKRAYACLGFQQPFSFERLCEDVTFDFLNSKINVFLNGWNIYLHVFITLVHAIVESVPLIKAGIESIIRIVNTLRNLISSGPILSEAERLENKVNAAIERLLLKDSDSAHRKGELLFNLWDKIKDDHANGQETYQNLFNKDYEIDGVIYTFKSVASATRLDEGQFNPQVVDNRFGFFGLRGSQTAADLQAYLSPQLV